MAELLHSSKQQPCMRDLSALTPTLWRFQDTSPLEKGDNLLEDHTSDLQIIDLYAGLGRLVVSYWSRFPAILTFPVRLD